jgi:nickel-dependent lactate racemase
LRINLAYGRTGLEVDLPYEVDVIRARFVPGIPDETDALKSAMRAPIASPPLRELIRPGDTVMIVHTDITRATPNDRILPVILQEYGARICVLPEGPQAIPYL